MIDKEKLNSFIESQLADTDCFLVLLEISSSNDIVVEIDSENPIDIDQCVALTRAIEQEFDRDVEDYQLEVGSAGLTSPLRVLPQYRKNIGNMLDIVTSDGKKLKALLTDVSDSAIEVETQQKIKKEGEKRPSIQTVKLSIPFSEIKKAVYHLDF